MPIGSEIVHIGYRNDDSAVILGYDITATTNNDRAGYDLLSTAKNNGVAAYASFRELNPGEFDFKSVGDAYILGSAFGTLLLAGSQAFIRLNGQAYRIESKASEYNFKSDVSQFRVGTVFRKIEGNDEEAVPKAGGSYKEFLVDIADSDSITGIAINPSKVRLHLGDILDDDLFIPEQSESNKDLRARLSISSDLLQESFKLEIDESGNVVWDQNTTSATDGLKMRASPILFDAISGENTTGGIIKINNGDINMGAEEANNKAILWNPGLKQELDNIRIDLQNTALDVKTHRHPLPVQSFGIPTGTFIQTIQTKFVGSVDLGFKIIEAGPGTQNLLNQPCLPNSGPMDVATQSSLDEINEIDPLIPSVTSPRDMGGFFNSAYSPGKPFSTIVKIEK